MLDFITNFLLDFGLELLYIALFGGFAAIIGSLLERQFFSYHLPKALALYVLVALFGALCASSVYALCEIFFLIPFYIQILISIVCAYFGIDIVVLLKNALHKSKSLTTKTYNTIFHNGIEIAPFLSTLKCEISNDGKSYTLLQGFYYQSKAGEHIIIPAGFKSDGFTNFGLHSIVPQYGKGLKCAILHDYLCEQAHKGKISRAKADEIFLESMLETKAFSKFRIYIIYIGVRLFAKVKGLDK